MVLKLLFCRKRHFFAIDLPTRTALDLRLECSQYLSNRLQFLACICLFYNVYHNPLNEAIPLTKGEHELAFPPQPYLQILMESDRNRVYPSASMEHLR